MVLVQRSLLLPIRAIVHSLKDSAIQTICRADFAKARLPKLLVKFHSYSTAIVFRSKFSWNWNSKQNPKIVNSSYKTRKGNLKTMKLDSEIFRQLFTPELCKLNDLFAIHGYEIRMAGGAVRDLLMNKQPHDIDFATTATPEQMKAMFEMENIRIINAKGEQHGTVTCRMNDKENFEVTTLRIDVVTDGRHAEVEFTKNWELDSGRRDLTVNSMFLGSDGTVFDYFNGIDDLENRVVRFVGNPNDRIREDYLRILRYFRFYGRISTSADKHEEVTLQAIQENVSGLERISGERIWMEFKKILQGSYAEQLILKMIEAGVGPYIGLPENPNVAEFKTICSKVKNLGIKLHPISMLASLLNDNTDVLNLNGRLKLSSFERDMTLFIVLHRTGNGPPHFIKYYQRILVSSKNKAKDVREWIEEILRYDGNSDLLRIFEKWTPPKFPVTGHHLIEIGVPPGRPMTLVLNHLKETWIEADFQMTAEQLLDNVGKILSEYNVQLKR